MNKPLILSGLALFFFELTGIPWLSAQEKDTLSYTKGAYMLQQLKLEPNPPEVGDQRIQVKLLNEQGQPVHDAEIEIEAFMPAMGTMPAMSSRVTAHHQGNGVYQAELEISMSGGWELPVRVKNKRESESTEFPFHITIDQAGFVYKGATKTSEKKGNATTIYISQPRQQLIGVELGAVERRNLAQEIRTVARLEMDESTIHDVVLKYSGYIDHLYADRTGDTVEAGQALFEIYSPELYNAESEYLQLFRSGGGKNLLKTVEEKLSLWDISPTELRQLTTQQSIPKRHKITSPISGIILHKNIVKGSFVNAGQQLFRIVDLSRIWIIADIFERDTAQVQRGNPVKVFLSHRPDFEINGTISYIYPTVDHKTRTTKVRIELMNPDHQLRPGMYGEALIQTNPGIRLAAPRRAILFSGRHRYVFVALGEGYFEPREVDIGIIGEEWVEIKKGLEAHEKITMSGNFLISSEAQLRNALPRWGKPKQIESAP